MLKKERLLKIVDLVNKNKMVTTSELMDQLNVSDMTIRRDLDELNKSGKLIRLHGGAQSIDSIDSEQPHYQKKSVHVEAKKQVAQLSASFIKDNETIYIGSGTTLEYMIPYIKNKNLRVITNSLLIFQDIKSTAHNLDILLIGGNYREMSGAFIGSLTNDVLKKLKFDKAFVSANGIHDEFIMNASAEEGQTQEIALNNSRIKYIVADSSKLNRDDFCQFYSLYDIDGLVTNQLDNLSLTQHYQKYTKIIQVEN